MEVLLLNPNNPVHGSKWPPLGLLYLAAALESGDYNVKVHDLCLGEPLGSQYDPDLIGITCTTPNFIAVREIVATCRRLWPGAAIIVGGPHISNLPDDCWELGADAACIGDGEEAILEAAEDVQMGRPLRAVYSSLGFRVDANRWPIPARHYVPMQRYTAREFGGPCAGVIFQRGCCFRCDFCSQHSGYRKVSARAIDNVLQELHELQSHYPSLFCFDDEINLGDNRLLYLCDAIKPFGFKFVCHVRADLFSEEQAGFLAQAGCGEVRVGVESGSDEILKTIHKGCTVADNTRARRIAKDFGIRFCAFMMLGLPGESPETVEQSRRWLLENRPDYFSVFTFQPFPGTRVYGQPQDYDIRFPKPLPYDKIRLDIRSTEAGPPPCIVSTSRMSSEQISTAVQQFDTELRREINS